VRPLSLATALLVTAGCQGLIGLDETHVVPDGSTEEPPPVSCGDVSFGVTSVGQSQIATLTVVSPAGSGAPLSVSVQPGVVAIGAGGDGCSGRTLAAGEVCTVALSYTPVIAGRLRSAVTIAAGDASAQCIVTGIGSARLKVALHGVRARVVSTPEGIDCDSKCETEFTDTAIELSGYTEVPGQLTIWEAACVDEDYHGATCRLRMDAEQVSAWVSFCGFNPWSGRTVTKVDAGRDPVIVADDDFATHIIRYNSDLGDFIQDSGGQYGWDHGNSFAGPGRNLALAVDHVGTLHATFYRTAGEVGLWYARRARQGEWSAEPIDLGAGIGDHSDVAVDAAGVVHVVYQDASGFFRYAHKAPGAPWVTSSPDIHDQSGKVPSLAIDHDGNLHVAFAMTDPAAPTSDQLIYAVGVVGAGEPTWSYLVVDRGVVVDATDIGLSAGNVHIAYHDTRGNDVRYATAPAGVETPEWTRETPDSGGDVGAGVRLALDSLAGVHLTYLDTRNADLKYAYRSAHTGAWQVSAIESSGTITGGHGLMLQPQGIEVVFRNGNALRTATSSCSPD